jgi:SAM-dependent methyltransferase
MVESAFPVSHPEKIVDTNTCACCGSRDSNYVSEYRLESDTHRALFGGRNVRRCRDCGLVQIHPRPNADELSLFYDTAYRTGGFNASFDLERYPYDSHWRLSRGRSIRNLIQRELKPSDGIRVLEIGAGFGNTLHAFKEYFPKAELVAVEGDPWCRLPLEKSGAAVIPGYWGDPQTEAKTAALGPFDIVVLAHVLEHVLEQAKFIQSIMALCPRGTLMIEVPNEGAIAEWIKHSPHLSFFDEHTLLKVIERAGFCVEWIGTAGPFPKIIINSNEKQQPSLVQRVKGYIPSSVKDSIKRLIGRGHSATDPADLQDRVRNRDFVPLTEFEEYGPQRLFLRALVSNARKHDNLN